jgi:Glycosyl hydrolases family 16
VTALVDVFGGPALDRTRWIDHYLPHWTTSERSSARYDFAPQGLRLRIDQDQLPWRPEDGAMRVSNIQTGSFAGPLGGVRGQHRHRADGLVVRSETPTRRLWTPTYGRVEVTASAGADPACMLGIWLVGVEDGSPEDAGEICLAELFGDRVGPDGSTVRLGIKAHHDPRLTTEMSDLLLPLDARSPHSYAAEWEPSGVDFFVDGELVKRSSQSLGYPMQLMVDLFEFPRGEERRPEDYPKTALVHRVEGRGGLASGAGR